MRTEGRTGAPTTSAMARPYQCCSRVSTIRSRLYHAASIQLSARPGFAPAFRGAYIATPRSNAPLVFGLLALPQIRPIGRYGSGSRTAFPAVQY